MKKIIIIRGITGAIGSALFALYGKSPQNIIYGISRKAIPLEKFLQSRKLPQRTLICSLQNYDDFEKMCSSLDTEGVSEIIYIHAIGFFPFEVTRDGKISIENDCDQDAINDTVTELTYRLFVESTQKLQKYWSGKLKCSIFGSIADAHKLDVHQSWWKTIEKVKKYMRQQVQTNKLLTMFVINISSVMCPHEVITRPFVFTNTEAEQAYWLSPYDLAKFTLKQLQKNIFGFIELNKFKNKPNFKTNFYYSNHEFTLRKLKELY